MVVKFVYKMAGIVFLTWLACIYTAIPVISGFYLQPQTYRISSTDLMSSNECKKELHLKIIEDIVLTFIKYSHGEENNFSKEPFQLSISSLENVIRVWNISETANMTSLILRGDYVRIQLSSSVCSGFKIYPSFIIYVSVNAEILLKSCHDPGVPENGYRSGEERFPLGTKVRFSCHKDYNMYGNDLIVCVYDPVMGLFKWSQTRPVCAKPCKLPIPPRFGYMSVSDDRRILKFSCQDSFSLVGPSTLTCVNNASYHELTNFPPKCIVPSCPAKGIEILNYQSKFISTPGFPSNKILKNEHCSWKILTSKYNCIHIYFGTFDLPKDGARFEIYTSNHSDHGEGNLLFSSDVHSVPLTRAVIVCTDQLVVYYDSYDQEIEGYQGVYMRYKARPASRYRSGHIPGDTMLIEQKTTAPAIASEQARVDNNILVVKRVARSVQQSFAVERTGADESKIMTMSAQQGMSSDGLVASQSANSVNGIQVVTDPLETPAEVSIDYEVTETSVSGATRTESNGTSDAPEISDNVNETQVVTDPLETPAEVSIDHEVTKISGATRTENSDTSDTPEISDSVAEFTTPIQKTAQPAKTTVQARTENSSGSNTPAIVIGITVPVVLLIILGIIAYVWYRKKYPVRMIIGKDFGKFSNPAYSKRNSTATLTRTDSFDEEIKRMAAETCVSHDNPVDLSDETEYQPTSRLSLMASLGLRSGLDDIENSPEIKKRNNTKIRKKIVPGPKVVIEEEAETKADRVNESSDSSGDTSSEKSESKSISSEVWDENEFRPITDAPKIKRKRVSAYINEALDRQNSQTNSVSDEPSVTVPLPQSDSLSDHPDGEVCKEELNKGEQGEAKNEISEDVEEEKPSDDNVTDNLPHKTPEEGEVGNTLVATDDVPGYENKDDVSNDENVQEKSVCVVKKDIGDIKITDNVIDSVPSSGAELQSDVIKNQVSSEIKTEHALDTIKPEVKEREDFASNEFNFTAEEIMAEVTDLLREENQTTMETEYQGTDIRAGAQSSEVSGIGGTVHKSGGEKQVLITIGNMDALPEDNNEESLFVKQDINLMNGETLVNVSEEDSNDAEGDKIEDGFAIGSSSPIKDIPIGWLTTSNENETMPTSTDSIRNSVLSEPNIDIQVNNGVSNASVQISQTGNGSSTGSNQQSQLKIEKEEIEDSGEENMYENSNIVGYLTRDEMRELTARTKSFGEESMSSVYSSDVVEDENVVAEIQEQDFSSDLLSLDENDDMEIPFQTQMETQFQKLLTDIENKTDHESDFKGSEEQQGEQEVSGDIFISNGDQKEHPVEPRFDEVSKPLSEDILDLMSNDNQLNAPVPPPDKPDISSELQTFLGIEANSASSDPFRDFFQVKEQSDEISSGSNKTDAPAVVKGFDDEEKDNLQNGGKNKTTIKCLENENTSDEDTTDESDDDGIIRYTVNPQLEDEVDYSQEDGDGIEELQNSTEIVGKARRKSITVNNPMFDDLDLSKFQHVTESKRNDESNNDGNDPHQKVPVIRRQSVSLENPFFEVDDPSVPEIKEEKKKLHVIGVSHLLETSSSSSGESSSDEEDSESETGSTGEYQIDHSIDQGNKDVIDDDVLFNQSFDLHTRDMGISTFGMDDKESAEKRQDTRANLSATRNETDSCSSDNTSLDSTTMKEMEKLSSESEPELTKDSDTEPKCQTVCLTTDSETEQKSLEIKVSEAEHESDPMGRESNSHTNKKGQAISSATDDPERQQKTLGATTGAANVTSPKPFSLASLSRKFKSSFKTTPKAEIQTGDDDAMDV